LIGIKMPSRCNGAKHSGTHEDEVSPGIAIIGNKAEFRLHVGDAPAFEILGNDEAKQRPADTFVTEPGRFRFGNSLREMKLCDLGCRHVGASLISICHQYRAMSLICVKSCALAIMAARFPDRPERARHLHHRDDPETDQQPVVDRSAEQHFELGLEVLVECGLAATQGIYVAIVVAALARICAVIEPAYSVPLLHAAAFAWAAAYLGFAACYGPKLIGFEKPRIQRPASKLT
jgi:hypothetical protein